MKDRAKNQHRAALAGWEDDGGALRVVSGRAGDAVHWEFRLTADARRILVAVKGRTPAHRA